MVVGAALLRNAGKLWSANSRNALLRSQAVTGLPCVSVRTMHGDYVGKAEDWYFMDTEGNFERRIHRRRRLTPEEIEELDPRDRFTLSNVENLLRESQDDMPMANIPNPYKKEAQKCILCKYNIQVDYKNARLLSQFISRFTGRIYEQQTTGLCKLQHEYVMDAIARARKAGFLPYAYTEPVFYHDPRLFDPFRPQRRS